MSDSEGDDQNQPRPPPKYSLYTEFELEDENADTLLSIKNKERVNRLSATHDKVGRTWFAATLCLVHYAKYKGKSACIVGINFSFGFPRKSLGRFVYSELNVIFSQALDKKDPGVLATDPDKDPGVVDLAPVTLWGEAKTIDQKTKWSVDVPVKWKDGAEAGIDTKAAIEKSLSREHRMNIEGSEMFDDDHVTHANSVQWTMEENEVQKDGILKRFRGFIVVLLPEGAKTAMWVKVKVQPAVKFSVDPRRLYRKLIQKNDDPIYLDGKTPYCDLPDIEIGDNLGDPKSPWKELIVYPVEYTVCGDPDCFSCTKM